MYYNIIVDYQCICLIGDNKLIGWLYDLLPPFWHFSKCNIKIFPPVHLPFQPTLMYFIILKLPTVSSWHIYMKIIKVKQRCLPVWKNFISDNSFKRSQFVSMKVNHWQNTHACLLKLQSGDIMMTLFLKVKYSPTPLIQTSRDTGSISKWLGVQIMGYETPPLPPSI